MVEAEVLHLDHHIVATEAILAAVMEVIMGATTIHTLEQLSLGITDRRLDFTTGLITTITLMLITELEPLKLPASLKMPSVSAMLQNVLQTPGSSLDFLLASLA